MPDIANDRHHIEDMCDDLELKDLIRVLYSKFAKYKYSYNFTWMGRPIIQLPSDIIALQEIVWRVKPDLLIETGIAHGGSLIFYASLFEAMGKGKILGIDIEIREHNRDQITSHHLFHRIDLIEGSSIDPEVIKQVKDVSKKYKIIMVVLDSMHTHTHVLKELIAYSGLVPKGSYIIVMDTNIEEMPPQSFPNRPWDKGDNPKTAIWEFLENDKRFIVDKVISEKLLISACQDGFLRCIKE